MADLYGTHVYFREALRTIPRDKVTILTKLWWRYDGPEKDLRASYRKQACHTALQRFCHEINTDHLDIVLLHCLTKGGWDQEMDIYMEALNEAKQKGQVRAVGVSCHDLNAMKTAAACPWVDVLLARINPNGDKMDGSPAEVIEVLRQTKANGKAVIGMKIFGEGALSPRREECIRFAQELGLLDTMTIGFEKPEQVDDVLQLIAKYPARSFA
jgi:aryl-alcohol dehydrogenase-like predicted oxidoreductase